MNALHGLLFVVDYLAYVWRPKWMNLRTWLAKLEFKFEENLSESCWRLPQRLCLSRSIAAKTWLINCRIYYPGTPNKIQTSQIPFSTLYEKKNEINCKKQKQNQNETQ